MTVVKHAEAAVFTTRANGARNARFPFRRLYSLGRIFVLDFRSYGSAATRVRIYGDGRSTGTEIRAHPRMRVPHGNTGEFSDFSLDPDTMSGCIFFGIGNSVLFRDNA